MKKLIGRSLAALAIGLVGAPTAHADDVNREVCLAVMALYISPNVALVTTTPSACYMATPEHHRHPEQAPGRKAIAFADPVAVRMRSCATASAFARIRCA